MPERIRFCRSDKVIGHQRRYIGIINVFSGSKQFNASVAVDTTCQVNERLSETYV